MLGRGKYNIGPNVGRLPWPFSGYHFVKAIRPFAFSFAKPFLPIRQTRKTLLLPN